MVANTLANDDLIYIRVRNSDGVILSSGGDAQMLRSEFVPDPDFDSAVSDHLVDIEGSILIAGQSFGSVELGISTNKVETEMAAAFALERDCRSYWHDACCDLWIYAWFGF